MINTMEQNKIIIVISEDFNIREVAVNYAAVLAQRIDAQIIFLLLMEYKLDSKDEPVLLKQKYKDIILKRVNGIIDNNIPVQVEVMLGDRRSEFYKFMASHRLFHTVVWGGDENAPINKTGRSASHWLARIKDELPCPLVIPKKKYKLR